MACGLPCIASRIRGNVDLLENNAGGILVAPQVVTEYVDALNLLYENPLLRREFGQANLMAVRKFDTDIVKARIKEIYGTVLL